MQGESVPGSRKGKAATHLRDIEKYFHGAHLTITARDEEEIDEGIILDKVSKVSATAYNFKEKQTFGEEAPVEPVGSNHKKINPKAELPNMEDREKFWNSEESKEKERIADEKVRKKSEIKQLGMYIIYYLSNYLVKLKYEKGFDFFFRFREASS